MLKTAALLSVIFVFLTAAACGKLPSETIGTDTSPEISGKQSFAPTPSINTNPRAQINNDERAEMLFGFLEDNYSVLTNALYGGVAGIGFADLDCDGGMEMILFDAGASASMGVQIFDIVDGTVECISANIAGIGESFGAGNFSDIFISANYFDDFRLMQDINTGEKFFLVESSNGALDFSFKEKIRLAANGETLTLESLSHAYYKYDDEGREVTDANYRLGAKLASKDEYDVAEEKLKTNLTDLGLEIKGIFAWEKSNYSEDLDSLLGMAEGALALAAEQIDLY